MVDYPDIINFSRDELLEEYCKLFDRFQDLRESNEADTQKIHELKRSLDTATAAQAYLTQELEQYTNSDSNEIEHDLHKTQAELLDMKKKYGKLEGSFTTLQQDYNALLEENAKIAHDLEESLKRKEHVPKEIDTQITDDYLMRIQALENENMDLLQKIEDFEERSVRYTLTIAECEKNMEILRDQIMCLEENLQSKRVDLEEKIQILESTQEQLAEANAQIAMMSAAPDNDERKGNSLFAEVDDQRQAMKQLLTAQKKSYVQMKKIYNESEHEIRRLKRENISMHTELEACSSIFCNADKIYQEKLNERVRHLLNQNEDLERQLKWTQDRLKDMANDKGVLFLDSMLSFCKKETEDLKSQLHSVRIQKASLEEQLRNAQQDMARWRFESLKSRCILIDREHLLTENKINFKPVHAIEYNISEKEQAEAKPRIVSNRRSSTFDNIVERRSMTPSKGPTRQEMSSPLPNSITTTPKIKTEDKLNNNNIEAVTPIAKEHNEETLEQELLCKEIKDISIKEEKPAIIVKKQEENLNNNEDKENNNNNNINKLDDSPSLDNFSKLTAKPPSPMRPSQRSLEKPTIKSIAPPARSILSKQNDLLFKDSGKNVKFSSNADTVHNLSPGTPSPTKATTNTSNLKTEAKSTTTTTATNKVNSKSTVKQSRTKSNIVVRRVVVSSKHD
ncbi:protein Spindly [Lucilia sericata]|uniref:protein Spindly n=1 Tax=Lucilia sericata TaxID=13632 RepID=UPI0018A816F5|nr:protein Spindly [Lucilia sericata]